MMDATGLMGHYTYDSLQRVVFNNAFTYVYNTNLQYSSVNISGILTNNFFLSYDSVGVDSLQQYSSSVLFSRDYFRHSANTAVYESFRTSGTNKVEHLYDSIASFTNGDSAYHYKNILWNGVNYQIIQEYKAIGVSCTCITSTASPNFPLFVNTAPLFVWSNDSLVSYSGYAIYYHKQLPTTLRHIANESLRITPLAKYRLNGAQVNH